MRVKRKIIINQLEIDSIKHENSMLVRENAGQHYVPQLKVPDPIYRVYEWNFKVNQLNSYYIERTIVTNEGEIKKVPKGEGDIIASVLYEGIVRLEYDPLVISKFNLVLNGE